MSTQQQPSEEIDLGQLFKLIGDGFNKLFKFIGNLFNTLFRGIILVLLFLQKHFIKFVIAAIVGVIVGWYWDSVSDPIYRSAMIVEPNFNSAQQLYNNITFYNELAEEESYQTLAASLKISDKEAATIQKIEIEAFSDENQKLKQFSDFMVTLDSTSRASLSYEDYLKNFNNINAKFHKIELESTNSEVAKKCQKAIVRSIENNTYFSTQKNTNDFNIALSEKTIKEQIEQIDSLKKFYQELKILELKRPEGTSATKINLASDKSDLDRPEITLLEKAKELNEEIQEIHQKKADSENIINVISDFPDKGGLVSDFVTRKVFLLPLLSIAGLIIVLALLALNGYLNAFKTKE